LTKFYSSLLVSSLTSQKILYAQNKKERKKNSLRVAAANLNKINGILNITIITEKI
jgi:hypothetical protein